MAFPVVMLIVNIVDKETLVNLLPTFPYNVELTGFSPSPNEHPEVVRITTEEKAKVMFASRFVNKYLRETYPSLADKNLTINMEVISIT